MLSNHLMLCRPLLLLPSIFPSIRFFSNELALYIRWLKYCSFNFSITPGVLFKMKIPGHSWRSRMSGPLGEGPRNLPFKQTPLGSQQNGGDV